MTTTSARVLATVFIDEAEIKRILKDNMVDDSGYESKGICEIEIKKDKGTSHSSHTFSKWGASLAL